MKKDHISGKDRENFEIKISKEQLALLEPEKYRGEIIVIEKPEDIDSAVKELENADLIGFDTETKPNFQKGKMNQVALLQLATVSKCFLFRLSKIGLPDSIKSILENENLLKVGLSIKDDFLSLSKISKVNPKGFIDLQEYVRHFCISDISLTKIHAIVFGKRISKSQQLTNWEACTLTQKQLEYAALDALACINIFKELSSSKFSIENNPYRKIIGTE